MMKAIFTIAICLLVTYTQYCDAGSFVAAIAEHTVVQGTPNIFFSSITLLVIKY